MRIVNVHQAKTRLSRLIDAAQAGETILPAKVGKPCARLMPLEAPTPQRVMELALWQACLLVPATPRS